MTEPHTTPTEALESVLHNKRSCPPQLESSPLSHEDPAQPTISHNNNQKTKIKILEKRMYIFKVYMLIWYMYTLWEIHHGSVVKNPPDNIGNAVSFPGWRRPPGEGNNKPFKCSCLENPKDRGAWWAIVHGVPKESDMTYWLNNNNTTLWNEHHNQTNSVQFISVVQSCLTLYDPMNHSTPGLPVHHQLPESTQTHVHWVGDAIQPSLPLSSPSSPALNLYQHQGLFK